MTGDRYGGDWPVDRFKAHGINYLPSERVKSDIYRELLPQLNAQRVELLENKRLHAQLLGLERRTARGGRDSIDHAPGGHDDVANAAAGAIVLCAKPSELEIWAKLGKDAAAMPGYRDYRTYDAPQPQPQLQLSRNLRTNSPATVPSPTAAPSDRDDQFAPRCLRAGLNRFGTS